MRARLAALLAAFAAVLAMALAPSVAATAVADPPCPDGTSWDNIMHVCR